MLEGENKSLRIDGQIKKKKKAKKTKRILLAPSRILYLLGI